MGLDPALVAVARHAGEIFEPRAGHRAVEHVVASAGQIHDAERSGGCFVILKFFGGQREIKKLLEK